MPARLTASLLALALGAAAVALVSCGGGDDARLLPGETAREITANLDAVERLADEGDCAGAEGAAEQVSAQVESLQGVDPELERALRRGAARLNEVVADCQEATTEAVAPARIPETTESTEDEGKKEEREREKEEKRAEREAEREEEAEPGPPEEVPPPHSEGQGEGPGSDEGPSGGVSPGSAVEESGDDD